MEEPIVDAPEEQPYIVVEATRLKELGNSYYRNGDFVMASQLFTDAIAVDPTMAQLYCNRSMCYGATGNWEESVKDARIAVRLADNYEKAYFRLVKGLLELGKIKEAGQTLLLSYKQCNESKVLQALEKDFFAKSGYYLRPKPHEFDVKDELGDGNFSKIYRALFRPTGDVYAIKVIVLVSMVDG